MDVQEGNDVTIDILQVHKSSVPAAMSTPVMIPTPTSVAIPAPTSMAESKQCTSCKQVKPLEAFYKETPRKGQPPDKRKSKCIECTLEQKRERDKLKRVGIN